MAAPYPKPLRSAQTGEVLIHQLRVLAEEAIVQGPDEQEQRVPFQLVTQQCGQALGVGGGQKAGAGGRVTPGTDGTQGLAKLIGIARCGEGEWLQVSGGSGVPTPLVRGREAWGSPLWGPRRLLVVLVTHLHEEKELQGHPRHGSGEPSPRETVCEQTGQPGAKVASATRCFRGTEGGTAWPLCGAHRPPTQLWTRG